MHPAIRSYDEQAFDNMSEKVKKKYFIVEKSLRQVPNHGEVEQAKKTGGFRPQRCYLGYALRPHRER